jgi:hypothetical protein
VIDSLLGDDRRHRIIKYDRPKLDKVRKKTFDSITNVLDTMTLFISVDDQAYFSEGAQVWLNSYIQSTRESNILRKEDLDYLSLVEQLKRKTTKVGIDISKIKPTFKYRIIKPSKKNENDYSPKNLGLIGFSPVIFDDDYEKACLYSYFIIGTLAGHGYIILLKKINNKWVIKIIRDIWIS